MEHLREFWRHLSGADRTVLLLAWAGALASLGWYLQAPAGRTAVVVVDDRIIADLDLHRDRTLTVSGARGESRLRVREGAVRFVHSACHARRCVAAGWLDQAGETAACSPNHVLVRVRGPGESYDALNF